MRSITVSTARKKQSPSPWYRVCVPINQILIILRLSMMWSDGPDFGLRGTTERGLACTGWPWIIIWCFKAFSVASDTATLNSGNDCSSRATFVSALMNVINYPVRAG